MKHALLRSAVATMGVAVALLAASDARSESHYAVMTESVNNYTVCCPNNSCPNLNQNAAADNFINELLYGYLDTNPAGFTQGARYKDTNVYDSDFLDPDLINHAPGNPDDTYEFDNWSGLGISFYGGHGAQVPKSTVVCTNGASQCTQANAPPGTYVGLTGLGTCAISPSSVAKYGAGNGLCNYVQPNTVNPTIDTCSPASSNSNHAQFGYMALGETQATGNWRGAGTNGGTSMALIHMSYSLWTFFPETSWWSMFAGVHLIAGNLTSWGDINDSTVFGSDFAQSYVFNPYGEVQAAYVNAMALENDGNGCNNDGSPRGGFNGCGCNMIMTISSSGSSAYSAFHENWFGLTSDMPSQNGSGYWYWNAGCNYDTNAYPWSGGD